MGALLFRLVVLEVEGGDDATLSEEENSSSSGSSNDKALIFCRANPAARRLDRRMGLIRGLRIETSLFWDANSCALRIDALSVTQPTNGNDVVRLTTVTTHA